MVPKHCSVRTKSHKIIHYYQFDEWELFDLSKDPAEKNNLLLKNESRDLELEMKELLQKTLAKVLEMMHLLRLCQKNGGAFTADQKLEMSES